MRYERKELFQAAVDTWRTRLEHPTAGIRTVEAIRPVLRDWLEREHGALTFRLTQVLSGHGCFGRYLYKIARREPTPVCHECGCTEDTAQHTLEVCPAWAIERQDLAMVVGPNLSLTSLVHEMTKCEDVWRAAIFFCEEVMSQKESAERARESNSLADPVRRKRAGRRRIAQDRQLPP
ncbi:uncharacterized protein [Choristoneura fumiferana]|uniref:uncharacterized protein n=1 Tax=Choristoneura fumiferana TaxID=7141 RepID=UPI003D156F70